MTLLAERGGLVGLWTEEVFLERMIDGVLYFPIRPLPSSTTKQDLHCRKTDTVRQIRVVRFEARRLVHEEHDLRMRAYVHTSCTHIPARKLPDTVSKALHGKRHPPYRT